MADAAYLEHGNSSVSDACGVPLIAVSVWLIVISQGLNPLQWGFFFVPSCVLILLTLLDYIIFSCKG